MKFYIYPDDHGSAHVHIIGPGAEAKIYIQTLEVQSSNGFSKKALNLIIKKVEEYKEILLEAWEAIHGEKEN